MLGEAANNSLTGGAGYGPRVIVDVVLAAEARLAEGPVWDPRSSCLRWVDIERGQVHRFDPASGVDTYFEVGEDVGTVAVRAAGGLVIATTTGLYTCLEDGGRKTLLHAVDTAPPGGRFNDGKADPWGRFWAGTLLNDPGGACALYRMDPDHSLHTMVTGVSCSNGLGWSPDGAVMYYIDTKTGGVDAFDHSVSSGALSGRRRIIDIDRGSPDGMTIDADGCLWVALWDGWGLQRFAPDGRLLTTVEVPAQRVTSCAFGGPTLSTLYITTARTGLADFTDQPHAGSLFAVEPGVTGMAPGEWAG
jgi:sugar lactone lactonase YvrE